MAWFKSKEQQAHDAVLQKRAAAVAALADAEARRDERAVEIALSPDPWAGEKDLDAVRRAREQLELCDTALANLGKLEAQRKAQAEAALRATRDRAERQKIGKLLKGSRHFEAAAKNLISSFDDMLEAGDEIRRLLPPGHDGFASAVSYTALRRLCEQELNRQGCNDPTHVNSRPGAPGTAYHGGFQRLTTPRLSEYLEEKLLRLFAFQTGQPVAPPKLLLSPPAAAAEPDPLPPPAISEPAPDPGPRPQDIAPPPPAFNPEAVHTDNPRPEAAGSMN
jgi:hypothetical protein